MNINATLFGQFITFGIFFWINMKFICPKIISVLNERENKILNGLQAAEQGQRKLEEAILLAKEKEQEAIQYCSQLIDEAKKQSAKILETSIAEAKQKSEGIIKSAYLDLHKEQLNLQAKLQEHLNNLIVQGVEKIIFAEINEQKHVNILNEISNRIYEIKQ